MEGLFYGDFIFCADEEGEFDDFTDGCDFVDEGLIDVMSVRDGSEGEVDREPPVSSSSSPPAFGDPPSRGYNEAV